MTPCTLYLQKQPLSWLFIFLPQYGPPYRGKPAFLGTLESRPLMKTSNSSHLHPQQYLLSPRGLLSVAVHQSAGGQAGRQAAVVHHDS